MKNDMKVVCLDWWDGSDSERDYLFVSNSATTEILERLATEALNHDNGGECDVFRDLLTKHNIAWSTFSYTLIDFNSRS
jgi:hypothetical protein